MYKYIPKSEKSKPAPAQIQREKRTEEEWRKEEKEWKDAISNGVLINAKRWQDIQHKNDEIARLRQRIRELGQPSRAHTDNREERDHV